MTLFFVRARQPTPMACGTICYESLQGWSARPHNFPGRIFAIAGSGEVGLLSDAAWPHRRQQLSWTSVPASSASDRLPSIRRWQKPAASGARSDAGCYRSLLRSGKAAGVRLAAGPAFTTARCGLYTKLGFRHPRSRGRFLQGKALGLKFPGLRGPECRRRPMWPFCKTASTTRSMVFDRGVELRGTRSIRKGRIGRRTSRAAITGYTTGIAFSAHKRRGDEPGLDGP